MTDALSQQTREPVPTTPGGLCPENGSQHIFLVFSTAKGKMMTDLDRTLLYTQPCDPFSWLKTLLGETTLVRNLHSGFR
jgi:hypothetical protein